MSESAAIYDLDVGDTGGIRVDDRQVVTDESGRIADSMMFEQVARLERHWYTPADGVWCLVGNGLSNQTFVRGPEGIIAIDTGESVEEMTAALAELRAVTDEPIVAVLYTHFHYINGTTAITATEPVGAIHGHERIAGNLARSGGEIGPAYGRGIVEQFALALPVEGPDASVGVGLGLGYRNPVHAPYTDGHVPANQTFGGSCRLRVAGLDVDVEPAPSDADDSVTYWFPELGVAVHNLVWPTLFNIFAIRGEEYRDPQRMLVGLDHLRSLNAEHLVGTHGPPMSGTAEIARRTTAYRDSIEYLWDQTVRWTNRGASGPELSHRIHLPEIYGDDWITQQHYGLVEHHVRQIRSGLFGFFDGDSANLLPLNRDEHADRLIAAMGGADTVRGICRTALEGVPAAEDDLELRWALQLASHLHASSTCAEDDRQLLATVLRTVARRTSAANIRNWCLTRARHIDGTNDLGRLNQHRVSKSQAAKWPLSRTVSVLRVFVDPDLCADIDLHVAIELGGERSGLHFRNHIACPTDGTGASATITGERTAWNSVVAGADTLADCLAVGRLRVDPASADDVVGVTGRVVDAFACLEHPGFSRSTR